MNVDETINERELRNQVNRVIGAGVHGIFPFGTNGEAYILSMKEKEEILEAAVDGQDGEVLADVPGEVDVRLEIVQVAAGVLGAHDDVHVTGELGHGLRQ